MDTKPITSGSFPEKPVNEEPMPAQVPSIFIAEPTKPMPQERKVAPSEPEPSTFEVQVSILEGEDVRANMRLLEPSPVTSPIHI